MDFLFKELIMFGDFPGVLEFLGELILTVVLSFLLSLLITWTYRKTHQGKVWSPAFLHTMVVMGVVVAVVILVIGSNLARAFGLAGALSIVRFRSAIRDPRDVAFIFFAMGAGLAVGTGFYLAGTIFVLLLSAIFIILHRANYGLVQDPPKTLKVLIPENLNYEGLFDDIFEQYLSSYQLNSVQTTNLGTMFELVYSVRSKGQSNDKVLLDAIRARNGNLRVLMLLGASPEQG